LNDGDINHQKKKASPENKNGKDPVSIIPTVETKYSVVYLNSKQPKMEQELICVNCVR
jgi:hypothetical protein